ncbi:MAG: M57 family metalloprotease [Bacteroidota bacterium]
MLKCDHILKFLPMQNFKAFPVFLFVFFTISILFTSCQKDEVQSEVKEEIAIDDMKLLDDPVSDEIVKKLNATAFNPNGVRHVEIERPDGTTEKALLIEEDITMSVDQLDDMFSYGGVDFTDKHYRTNALVNSPRTIRVEGYTGGSFALTSKMRTGLQWAINNYNRLNLELNFVLTFGTNTSRDIVVYKVNNSGGGGSAGFPSGGRPYKWVRINSGTNNFSTNVNEHVIGHEIGHCIGFRHTDYFSRQSCGQNSNEGSAGVGAVYIPGTPSGYDPTSLMLACFSTSTDGEFNGNDITALRFLY